MNRQVMTASLLCVLVDDGNGALYIGGAIDLRHCQIGQSFRSMLADEGDILLEECAARIMQPCADPVKAIIVTGYERCYQLRMLCLAAGCGAILAVQCDIKNGSEFLL